MINKMILQGRLIRDPELTTINSGTQLCKFAVAWSETYGDKETQLFVNCTAWARTAEFVSQYFVKGQECIIEGKLETQKYEKDGENKTATNCTVDKVHFCGKKQTDTAPPSQPPSQPQGQKTTKANLKPVEDDGLPF